MFVLYFCWNFCIFGESNESCICEWECIFLMRTKWAERDFLSQFTQLTTLDSTQLSYCTCTTFSLLSTRHCCALVFFLFFSVLLKTWLVLQLSSASTLECCKRQTQCDIKDMTIFSWSSWRARIFFLFQDSQLEVKFNFNFLIEVDPLMIAKRKRSQTKMNQCKYWTKTAPVWSSKAC